MQLTGSSKHFTAVPKDIEASNGELSKRAPRARAATRFNLISCHPPLLGVEHMFPRKTISFGSLELAECQAKFIAHDRHLALTQRYLLELPGINWTLMRCRLLWLQSWFQSQFCNSFSLVWMLKNFLELSSCRINKHEAICSSKIKLQKGSFFWCLSKVWSSSRLLRWKISISDCSMSADARWRNCETI